MKIGKIKSTWVKEEGLRLDCMPYLFGAAEVKHMLNELDVPKSCLSSLTNGRKGIYHAGRYRRIWVNDLDFGVKFLSSRDILQSDLNNLSLISKKSTQLNKNLLLKKGQILITRSGTVGRMAYARESMDNLACTEDVLRVEVDESLIGSGYLYALFNTKFGMPLIVSGTYGAMIKHIEPAHIENMPIPRLGEIIENQADRLIKCAAELRDEYQKKVNQATDLLFDSAGLKDITPYEWHNQGADTGYSVTLTSSRSIRALNFNSRYQYLIETLESVEHKTLGKICEGGLLSRGGRFKRVDASPKYGIKLIGQKQGFWAKPEGRWIAPKYAKDEIVVSDETVLIASQGTLGEREVFCRSIFATGKWLELGYSEHFLRVLSNDSDISGAYLYAFLRSETAFRCLRSMSIGSKQQDIHVGMLSELPVPIIDKKNKVKVEALIREAFIAKDSADEKEKQAITLVEDSIAEAVK